MCRGKDTGITRTYAGYKITLRPVQNLAEGTGCRATIRSPQGKAVFSASDWGIYFDEISGRDINGDGMPDVVLVGYAGGMHCCWTYWIISLGSELRVIRQVESMGEMRFRMNSKRGRVEIDATDGIFDGLDDLCHACSPFPTIHLLIEGGSFRDIGGQYLSKYDAEIREARKELKDDTLQDFRAGTLDDVSEKDRIKQKVLVIVLAYLYSGREQQAWKTFGQMWPPSDAKRMKQLVLQARNKGLIVLTRSRKDYAIP